MIKFVGGDFFDFEADIRINTVNCVGVMGAGVALAFKQKYPDMFKDYAKQCKNKLIRPGKPSVWETGDMFSKKLEIINFPTKDHWRKPSEYEYIESGLIWLAAYLSDKDGLTVTLPALGCGHGGLDWEVVKKLIQKYLGITSNTILVFEPASSKKAGKKTPVDSVKVANLELLGVRVLNTQSPLYPNGLMRYTEKDLYLLGKGNTEFDISIISSTKPSEIEASIINDFIEYCRINKLSILFGGSAFDKRMASISLKKGINTGVFLPSGILNSAEKMKSSKGELLVSILSIGDPYKSFDRKEYMPSVLSRMFMSKCVFFTTDKLSWIEKQKVLTKDNIVTSFFVNYNELQPEDYSAVIGANAKPIEVTNSKVPFEKLKV